MQRWERDEPDRPYVRRRNRDDDVLDLTGDEAVIDLTDPQEERAPEVDGRDFRILQRLRSRR